MAEKRLIDADVLTQKIEKWIVDEEECEGISPFIVTSTLKNVRELIAGAPSVQLETTHTAHWERIGESKMTCCSNCHFRDSALTQAFAKAYYNFCPACGAKMEDGSDDEPEL